MNEAPAERGDRGRLRILELGGGIFRDSAGDQTDFYWVDRRKFEGGRLLGPLASMRVLRKLRGGAYDLVAVNAPLISPWHPRSFLTVIRDWRLRSPSALFATFAVRYLHRLHRVPVAVVDLHDTFGIRAHNFGLLDRAAAYFKRELPVDKWQVFFRSAHWDLPGKRWRSKKRSQRLLARLRPLTLATGPTSRPLSQPKTADVFFAGDISPNSTLRSEGIAELLALRSEGIAVDYPEERIGHEEFTRRLAGAWLAWSPAGYGWQCYRHYESGLLGTVPVINYPTVHLHQPLEDGKHCIYYAPEPGGLSAAIRSALADKVRLERMAAAAREHVMAHHTARARVEYIVRVAIGRNLDGSPVTETDAVTANTD
jgi:hypothetical protein